MKVVVLAGGNSPERDVSLSSGWMISNALAEKGHAVVLVDAYLGIKAPEGGLNSLFLGKPEYEPGYHDIPSTPPDLELLKKLRYPDTGMFFGENVIDLCRLADVVFLGLHGAAGENGQVQAALDLLNIRYTGSGFSGCVTAMDKSITKELLHVNHLPTASWIYLRHPEELHWEMVEKIGFPCVIKPPRGGSSIGVSIPKNKQEFEAGINLALSKSDGVEHDLIIEKYVEGREFCVGILDNQPLPPIEIIPNEGWFDYEKKYQSGLTQEICPADIPQELAQRMQEAALKIHNVLRLGFYSRIDFKVDQNGNIFCLEANTLPGMTPNSLFPKEAAAAGITYADLCDKIVTNGQSRR